MVGVGLFFLFLGVLLFFDTGLLSIGNILFLVGLTLLIGAQRTLLFFNPIKRGKRRGKICFIVGFLLVFFGWAKIGILLEFFGIVEMFAPFFSIIVTTLSSLPVIGPIVTTPAVARVLNSISGTQSKQRARRGV